MSAINLGSLGIPPASGLANSALLRGKHYKTSILLLGSLLGRCVTDAKQLKDIDHEYYFRYSRQPISALDFGDRGYISPNPLL